MTMRRVPASLHRPRRAVPGPVAGQTLVEYTLILAILTVTMIAVFTLLGNRVVVVFSDMVNLLDTAQASH
ncbi:MAG: hypothetical protein WDO13_02965 [Verrucomicrobiota bacterium]